MFCRLPVSGLGELYRALALVDPACFWKESTNAKVMYTQVPRYVLVDSARIIG